MLVVVVMILLLVEVGVMLFSMMGDRLVRLEKWVWVNVWLFGSLIMCGVNLE